MVGRSRLGLAMHLAPSKIEFLLIAFDSILYLADFATFLNLSKANITRQIFRIMASNITSIDVITKYCQLSIDLKFLFAIIRLTTYLQIRRFSSIEHRDLESKIRLYVDAFGQLLICLSKFL